MIRPWRTCDCGSLWPVDVDWFPALMSAARSVQHLRLRVDRGTGDAAGGRPIARICLPLADRAEPAVLPPARARVFQGFPLRRPVAIPPVV
ncbi:hypothetical protein [Tabrizicola thermarum]|uniref:hypothetical protein n=1 Tax=Tabrizicola thermarum TaxID=2670345 RepID=UPI000FFCBFFC|nr:hypothetical protein [Tabrizicola thermarum]